MATIESDVLREARKESGMSQEQLAKNLDISQTQVSRYEKNPDSIPAGLFSEWTGMFGLTPTDVIQKSSSGSLQADPGDPYSGFRQDLDLLSRYIDVQAPAFLSEDSKEGEGEESETISEFPSASDLRGRIRELRQKPNVMTAGGFDTGKSYLANALMGKEVLPTSYQPATRVVTVVRHVDDRPDWQDEDVWLFDEGIWTDPNGSQAVDVSVLDEQDPCEDHRVLAGSHDLLGKYGVHRSEPTEKVKRKMEQAHSAVVYVDSPILKSCNLVDLPGFGDRPSGENGSQKSRDQKKAESALPFADVVLYASRIQGHLEGKDLARISSLLRRIPAPESQDEEFPVLGSFFLVGTHADRNVPKKEVKKIKREATRRLHQYLKGGVLGRYEKRVNKGRSGPGIEVTVEDLRRQWFPFWAENEKRSRPLVDRVEEILGSKLPDVLVEKKRSELRTLREEAKARSGREAELYSEAAEENSKQKKKVKVLKDQADKRKEQLEAKQIEIHNLIKTLKRKSKSRVESVFDHNCRENVIKALIEENFDEKNKAKDNAPALVVETIEAKVEEEIEPLNDEFARKVEGYLDSVSELSLQADAEESLTVPFDARGAFTGGIAGAGTIGALATWASTMGNLGGYAIVAQGIGALSALGISISGGAAAATAWVSSLGGPIVFAATIAAIVGLAGWRLLKEDWQERLARKIKVHLDEKGFREDFVDGVDQYWDDTQDAFDEGARAVRVEFERYVDRLDQLAEKEERSRRLASRLEEARDFYAGMPIQ